MPCLRMWIKTRVNEGYLLQACSMITMQIIYVWDFLEIGVLVSQCFSAALKWNDGCIFVVTGCIDTPSKVSLITSPCSKGYSMSAFFYTDLTTFLVRHWKTSLVFVIASVFEMHCSTEGPYK